MTEQRFKEIMAEDIPRLNIAGNTALAGLNLMAKYCPKSGVEHAEHDQIWGTSMPELIEGGITEEDVRLLNGYGWRIENDQMVRYV